MASEALKNLMAAAKHDNGRRRDDFADALSLLISTPGASTDDPEFNRKLTATSLKSRGDKIQGLAADFAIFDELFHEENDMAKEEPLHPEVQEALIALAGRMNAWLADNNADGDTKLTLLSPGMLTVNVASKGYRKVNHIGGEEFRMTNVHLGKTNKLIFTFKPVDAQAYLYMEMSEADAPTQLENFRQVANQACGGDFFAELKAIRTLESKAREREAMAGKFDEYQEFGSW